MTDLTFDFAAGYTVVTFEWKNTDPSITMCDLPWCTRMRALYLYKNDCTESINTLGGG